MTSKYAAPQAFSEAPRPPITLSPVTSNQVKAIGYDPATETLAVTFTRGAGAIYHYPGVTKELYAAFASAESIGRFFGQHIQPLPFEKFPAEDGQDAQAEAAA